MDWHQSETASIENGELSNLHPSARPHPSHKPRDRMWCGGGGEDLGPWVGGKKFWPLNSKAEMFRSCPHSCP